MNIKQLKLIIENLPDETIVVTSGSDHNYMVCVTATPLPALHENRCLYEYYEGDHGKIVNVLLME